MLHIYDGNNYFRRIVDGDSPHQKFFSEIQSRESLPIVVWDGKGSLVARRQIYPEYKTGRDKPSEDIYASRDFMRKVLLLSKAAQITVPGYEADDVIAYLTFKYEAQLVWIHTTDRDLTCLPYHKIDAKTICDDRHLVPVYKTLVGDPSDTIPGLPGFGEKGWERCHQKAFSAWMAGHFDCLDYMTPEDIMSRFDVSKAVANKLRDPEIIKNLRKYRKVIGFLPIRPQLIEEHTQIGLNRPDLAAKTFSEFML